jgi:prepilin-type N-terminal cleavage/methylation domain-containing protein
MKRDTNDLKRSVCIHTCSLIIKKKETTRKTGIKTGFSLAEMMIVMLIVSIVMAFTAPMLTKITALANIKKDIADLKTGLDNLTKTVNDLTTATSNGFNDVQTNLTGLDTRLDTLESNEDDESGCPDNFVRVFDLCIPKTDQSSGTDWNTANAICSNAGMRLPNKQELNLLYLNKNTIGGFCTISSCNPDYWSSTKEGYGLLNAWVQHFSSGEQGGDGKSSALAELGVLGTLINPLSL